MYHKINLHSADTSVKQMWTLILGHKNCNKWTLQGFFSSKSSAQTPLTLFSNVILKLGTCRLFQIDALTDLDIVLSAVFDLTCTLRYTVLQKGK